jgi:hypothetical protein
MAPPNEHRPNLSTPYPGNLGKSSGSYRIDLSSVPPDETSAKEPWARLTRCLEGQAELSLPDCPPLRRPLPVLDLDLAIVESLREWLGDDAVRHWVALRQLKSSSGRAQWKLDAHMDAIGEPREDAEARLRAAREVERLTGLQMTVFTPRGELRLRAPLLVAVATTERQRGGYWLLDDMLLRVHPMLSDPWIAPAAHDAAHDTTRPSEGIAGEIEPGVEVEFPPNEPETGQTMRLTQPPPTEPVPLVAMAAALPSPARPEVLVDDDPTVSERRPSQ